MSNGDYAELYRKYRPQTPKELVGQDEAVATLGGMGRSGKIPHVLLLTGPSGCGKTTIARMMARMLKCGEGDLTETNAAQVRGIDYIRQLQGTVQMLPISGNVRVWIIDECHQLTKDAQDAFLKLLEDQPRHAYFFLCTNEPEKLRKTILTRSTEIKLKDISKEELVGLVSNIAAKEGIEIDKDVAVKISESAEGSARKAIVLLQQVMHIPNKEVQLEAIARGDVSTPSRTIAQALINGGSMAEICDILKTVSDQEVESVRRGVLGYATAVFVNSKGKNRKALAILENFQFDFFTSGKAGLALACHNSLEK